MMAVLSVDMTTLFMPAAPLRSETTKVGVGRQVTVSLSVDMIMSFPPATPLRSETTRVSVGKHAMAVLSVGLVVSFPLLTGWVLKYKSKSLSLLSHDLVGQSASSSMTSHSFQTKLYTFHLLEYPMLLWISPPM